MKPLILFAQENCFILINKATHRPVSILVDIKNLDDQSFCPDNHARVRVPIDVYNESIKEEDPHALAIKYAIDRYNLWRNSGGA